MRKTGGFLSKQTPPLYRKLQMGEKSLAKTFFKTYKWAGNWSYIMRELSGSDLSNRVRFRYKLKVKTFNICPRKRNKKRNRENEGRKEQIFLMFILKYMHLKPSSLQGPSAEPPICIAECQTCSSWMEKRDLITRLKVTPSMGQEKDAAQVPSTEIKI